MAKFNLAPGEQLVGSGAMSLYEKQGLGMKPFQGKIYVTNQRALFYIDMVKEPSMELAIGDIKGFSVSKALMITKVTIHGRNGSVYSFTGFPAKKLQGWLADQGVAQL